MTRKLDVNQARVVFDAMVGEANKRLDKYIITNHGKKRAILMSFMEYEALLECMEMFSEDKAAVLK